MISHKKSTLSSNSGRPHNKEKPIPYMIGNTSAIEFSRTKDDTRKYKPYCNEDSDEQRFHSQVERFIEISKYFSSPLRKTATYICDSNLVSFPNSIRIDIERSGVTSHYFKFCNHTLQAVFIRLFKVIPDLEQIKFINLPLSRSKRIPPGLSFNLGFVYDDVNDKEIENAKMIFVASRKSMTPCYQICEIELQIGSKGRPGNYN